MPRHVTYILENYQLPSYKECFSTGNVALGKTVNSSGELKIHPAAKAVDGRLPVGDQENCAHTSDTFSGQAWMIIDLHEEHVIFNITIYNRKSITCKSVLSKHDSISHFTLKNRKFSNS